MPHEIEFSDAKLAKALDEFFEHIGPRLNPEWRGMLAAAFNQGWAASMFHNMGPSVELCMWFMRFSTLQQRHSGDEKEATVVLTRDVLDTLLDKCRAIVGEPDLVGLTANIEAVVLDDDDGEPKEKE